MAVRWEDVANEWLDSHARDVSPASRESLRKLLACVRAASHKEAVAETLVLDADVAEQLSILLERRRSEGLPR